MNKVLIVNNKYSGLKMKVRIWLLKFLGMKIGEKCQIEEILCGWPNKVTIGDKSVIEAGVLFKITKPFEISNHIYIGSHCFIGAFCQFNINSQIIIYDHVLIASNCTFVDTGHEYEKDTLIRQQPLTVSPIIIEEDVWIGTNCIILQGVTIGAGSIVGAGSLVNKSIPPCEIWAGTPAKFIKKRI